MDCQTNITRFVSTAKEFCSWVEGTPGANDVFDSMRLLSRLHADAVMLPDVDDEYLPQPEDIPEPQPGHKQAGADRFRMFPFQYYWEIFTPITERPEEAVCGDIADDLSDIYQDVKVGLLAWDLGREPQAVWQWRFTWGIHWGEHATSALRALHSYQKNND